MGCISKAYTKPTCVSEYFGVCEKNSGRINFGIISSSFFLVKFRIDMTKWPEKFKIHKLKFNFVVQHRITLSSYHLSKRLNDFKLLDSVSFESTDLWCDGHSLAESRSAQNPVMIWPNINFKFNFSFAQLNAWPISLYLHFDRCLQFLHHAPYGHQRQCILAWFDEREKRNETQI